MTIFSVSPPKNVNRGLAEPWVSALPMQIDLLKSAARLRAHAADMQQRRDLAQQKMAMEWWDAFSPDMTKLLPGQQNDAGAEYGDYLNKYAGYINSNQLPEDMRSVMMDRERITRLVGRYGANNKELAEVKEFVKSPAGAYIPEEKIAPLLVNNVALDENGDQRRDVMSGEYFKFINNDPRSVDVWNEDVLGKDFNTNFIAEKKEYFDRHVSVDNEGNPVTFEVEWSRTGLNIWDERALRGGQYVLKDDAVASIPRISPKFDTKIKRIRQLREEDDSVPDKTYGQIASEILERQSRGTYQIEKWAETTASSGSSGDASIREDKMTLLDDVYSAQMRGDENSLQSYLNLVGSYYEGGIHFEKVGQTQKYFLPNDLDPGGLPKEHTIEGPHYVPIVTKPLQENISSMRKSYAARKTPDVSYEDVMSRPDKGLVEGNIAIPAMAISIPKEGDSAIKRGQIAADQTINLARLANMSAPDKERFSSAFLNSWRNKLLKEGVELFNEEQIMWPQNK